MKKFILIVITVCLAITAATAALLKDDQTLSVTGTGIVQVAPDTAYVKLAVEVVKKTAQEAQADNAATMDRITAAVIKLGIAKEKIQTAGYYIWPETKYEQNQPPKLVGYRCTNELNVTVEDMPKVSRVIDASIGAGANSVRGIQFARKNDEEFKRLALDKAVKDAAAKAQAIALAANLKLKGIKNIVESGAIVPLGNDYPALRAMGGAGGAGETPVNPGLLEVRGNVSLTYKVE
jgi:uncharacterized protein YggE